jgi:hypothetical protein
MNALFKTGLCGQMVSAVRASLLGVAGLMMAVSTMAQAHSLVGTWRLIAADKILPDGRQVPDYGSGPKGIAIFTEDGHYTVEIFRGERTKFASGDRAKGTPEEYKDAVLSTSCHFGTYDVDWVDNTITLHISHASYPNWDMTTRVGPFTLYGDTLSWRVPPRPDGSIPVSVFQRVR